MMTLCCAATAVISQQIILLVCSMQACYINFLERMTESPITEYSRRKPLVPITPEKTVPVEIPMLQSQFKVANSLSREKLVRMARTGSSWWDSGGRPNTTIKVDPLSSINILLSDPWW